MRSDIESPFYPGKPFISAEEVLMELQALGKKNIPKLPEYLNTLPPIRIFNISGMRQERNMGGLGTFTIQPCEKGKSFSAPLEICPIFPEAIAIDKDHMEYRFHDGIEIATTIVGTAKHMHPSENLTKWGCFIAAGSEPAAHELENANLALLETYEKLMQEAVMYLMQPGEDTISGKKIFRERNNITSLHMKAITALCPMAGYKLKH